MKQFSLDSLQQWLHRQRRPRGPAAWVQILAAYTLALLRDLLSGEVSLRAMSMVYTTLLSLVPLLALAFSLLKALGFGGALESVLDRLLAPLGPDASMISRHIAAFVGNVKVGVLGSLGVGLLLYWAVSLIYKLEASFNYFWEVDRGRARVQRFGEYVAVLVIGPTVVFTALGLTASLRNPHVVGSILQIEPFGSLLVMLSKLVPYILVVAVFSFLYGYIPNVRVKPRAALVGGLCAGLAWQTASAGFATFVSGATSYNAIYSSFAIFIFLLLWMYVGWLVLLLGCRLSFYVQNPGSLVRRPPPAYASREGEVMALAACALVCRAFRDADPAPTLEQLARQMLVPEPSLRRALAPLIAAGSLVQAGVAGGYLPGHDLDQLKVGTLWLQARGEFSVPSDGEVAASYITRAEAQACMDPTTVRQWLDGS